MTEPPRLDERDAPFFSVSPLKLCLLSVCTFGLYEVFWFYMHWVHVRYREPRIRPPWRALFGLVFCYPLFWRIRTASRETGIRISLLPEIAVVVYIPTVLVASLSEPEYNDLWTLSFLSFVPLVAVQSVVNRLHGRLGFDPKANSRFSGWNFLTVCIGGALFLLALLGTYGVPVD